MGHKVGLGVKIEEGVEILGTDKSMLLSVRDRDQSDSRDRVSLYQLRFGIDRDQRPKLLSRLPDLKVEVLISKPDSEPTRVFADSVLLEQV
jgi:hypothetical protein